MKNQIDLLPHTPITMKGPISNRCIAAGITTFKQACQHIQDLPYGELHCKSAWENSLEENAGTSSTKHAFLKALADELNIPCKLILGIYAMTEQNTPGVGVILDRHRMQSIPEAHCYLQLNNIRFDFTRSYYDDDYMEPIVSFIYEESISPINASHYKKETHQRIIAERFGKDRFDHIWNIRLKCIAALEH